MKWYLLKKRSDSGDVFGRKYQIYPEDLLEQGRSDPDFWLEVEIIGVLEFSEGLQSLLDGLELFDDALVHKTIAEDMSNAHGRKTSRDYLDELVTRVIETLNDRPKAKILELIKNKET